MRFAQGVAIVLVALLGMGQARAQCADGRCLMNMQIQQAPLQAQQAAAIAASWQPPPPPTFLEMMEARAAAQMRKGWGAMAASADLERIGVSSDRGGRRRAEGQALRKCGADCHLLASVDNGCIALALNANRLYAVATAKGQLEATRKALGECAAKSPDQVCHLYTEPLCAGVGGEVDVRTDLSPDELARVFESAADPRVYWGAIGRKGNKVFATANALSQAQAEAGLKAQCGNDCEGLATHSNSCAAVAWPVKAAQSFVVERNAYPELARINALATCRTRSGAACAVSTPTCSGRAYFGYDYGRIHTGAPMEDSSRSRQAGSSLLESWVGHSEEEFRGSWGSPDSDALDRLQYHLGHASQAGEQRNCTVNVFLRQGAVFSYLTEGAACGEMLQ